MKNKENISLVASEAAKIKRDYPELTFKECIDKAKYVLRDKLKNDNKKGPEASKQSKS